MQRRLQLLLFSSNIAVFHGGKQVTSVPCDSRQYPSFSIGGDANLASVVTLSSLSSLFDCFLHLSLSLYRQISSVNSTANSQVSRLVPATVISLVLDSMLLKLVPFLRKTDCADK